VAQPESPAAVRQYVSMAGASGGYRIYTDLADWWSLISPLREYTQEAAYLASVIDAAVGGDEGSSPEVLDLGSGGGHVAVHLAGRFRLTLLDISEHMLAVSRQLNPDCAHRLGDMRTVRLGRRFDAVLVHDAIDYIIGVDDLRQVIETAAAHCKLGGVALFVPDYLKETFNELTGGGGGGIDADGRTASFTERTWDPDPSDDWVQADYEFTLRDADGLRELVRETHRLSAFSRDTWLGLLDDAGFREETGLHQEHEIAGSRPPNLFIARLRTADDAAATGP
jgi:SAM-dependent methyltransferase